MPSSFEGSFTKYLKTGPPFELVALSSAELWVWDPKVN